MWILLGSIVVTAIALYGFRKIDSDSGLWVLSGIFTLIGGLSALCLLASIPFSRASCRDHAIQFKAFDETVRKARANTKLSEVERATILTGICTRNTWLASMKYWNEGQWDWWYPDDTLMMEPME